MNKLFRMTIRTRHMAEGYMFISIWLIGFVLFMAIPLGQSLLFSFQKLEISRNGLVSTFVALKNYRQAFTLDVEFMPLLVTSVGTMLLHVPLILVFSMFIALLLNRQVEGRAIYRGIFFLPVIVASGAVLQKLMDQGATTLPIFASRNIVNFLITYIPPEFLIPLLKVMDHLTLVMWASGVQIIIFLAGLQTISPSLYEAAKCDGATAWESFWKITLPMITPMVLVNVLYTIVNSFTNANNKVMTYIYQALFQKNQYGYASSLGWIYFTVIFIVIGIVLLAFKRFNIYTDERR